ncbi:hypothetical protein HRUBRA_02067 [Pseudohaliea rubra DSM 19751]|uniref:Uncharacterized protein n=1 Tax=Pseudohaliea rubra DSM 19751 TaxID=1265313 RepID=A0A095VPC0_9GAMM|nr:hypothetical protein HRUBRA_02067 [Pseudohaliea rubra DSM 19751]
MRHPGRRGRARQGNGAAVIDLFMERSRRRPMGKPCQVKSHVDAAGQRRNGPCGKVQRQRQRRVTTCLLHRITLRQEGLAKRAANEAGTTRDQTFHPDFVSTKLGAAVGRSARESPGKPTKKGP